MKQKRTAAERSAAAKDIWYKKELAKLKPETIRRIQSEYAAEVQDNFEQKYRVGKYAPQDMKQLAPYIPKFPTEETMHKTFNSVHQLINEGTYVTTKEEIRQDLEMANHHIGIAYRFVKKAITQ